MRRHAAKDNNDHERALDIYLTKRRYWLMNIMMNKKGLMPCNRPPELYGSLNRYEEAATKLETTIGIAINLNWLMSRFIISNLGRLAAVEIIHNVEAKHQIQALEERSLPKFKQAYKILKGHPHYFYPFTNAEHGSIVAALVGDRKFAAALVIEGMSLALRRSPNPMIKHHRILIANIVWLN